MSNDAKILLKLPQRRRSRAKSEKAIHKLAQENKPITFAEVREAGLSVSYLYKYPEIKERIEIRKQQLKADKPTSPESI